MAGEGLMKKKIDVHKDKALFLYLPWLTPSRRVARLIPAFVSHVPVVSSLQSSESFAPPFKLLSYGSVGMKGSIRLDAILGYTKFAAKMLYIGAKKRDPS